jgi:L-alanine-DL-glutamate epimerase-like enolase superfamily enzyme
VKITRIESWLTDHQALVHVYTDDGLVGIGQTSPHQPDITVDVLHKMVAPFFLGQNPWDIERLGARCLAKQYKFTGTFLYRALCGVDTAIWDLLGKATGQPVYRLLGGLERPQVPMYASSMRRDISPEDEAERLTREVNDHGFKCVKIRIGDRMGSDQDASPGRTRQIVPLMREALGGEVDINADANGGYSTSKAIQVGRLLEEHGYHHFEEPCPYPRLESSAEVAAALDIPVAGGEQDNSLEHFQRMITMRAVDIVQPDVGYIGGISRARRVAQMAEVAGIPCTPHCANRSMQMFTLHLAAAMPACYQYQEWSIEHSVTWATEIFEPELEVKDGVVQVPDDPGWGFQVQAAYYASAQQRSSVID